MSYSINITNVHTHISVKC